MDSVVCLKIERHAAGRNFPFDRVYFFKKDLLPRVKQLTPINLTFVITPNIRESLLTLPIEAIVKSDKSRRKTTYGLGWGIGNNGQRIIDFFRDEEGNCTSPAIASLITALMGNNLSDWMIMIPILDFTKKVGRESAPAYLVNTKWARNSRDMRVYGDQDTDLTVAKGKGVIPDSACLKVINEEITPPCRACPRLLEHLNGDCQIGGTVCLAEMSFDRPSYFSQSLLMKDMESNNKTSKVYAWLKESEDLGETPLGK